LPPFANEICNHHAIRPVIANSVDTISTTTWLITTLLSWFKLPYATMTKRLANWFAVSIRLLRKWSAPIDRDELVKRIFAK
jgi:hypothetical protein